VLPTVQEQIFTMVTTTTTTGYKVRKVRNVIPGRRLSQQHLTDSRPDRF